MLDPSILVGLGQPPSGGAPINEPSGVNRDESAERSLAAIVEMLARIDAANDLGGAASIAARLVAETLDASGVWIAWRDNSSRGQGQTSAFRLIGRCTADVPSEKAVDRDAFLLAACDEADSRQSATSWPSTEPHDRHALLAVAQLARSLQAEGILAIPIPDGHDQTRGMLVASLDAPVRNPHAANFLQTFTVPLGHKLDALQRLQPGPTESAVRRASAALRGHRGIRNVTMLAIVLACLSLPRPYRIRTHCELQPVHRRFVAAPFDGPLAQSSVRPGDIVSAGDLLARIDPREVEFQLAGVKADLSRAEQEKKSRMAQHDVAGGQIAALETEQLRLEKELLQHRLDHLEIRSPLRGVVVTGDLKESEGVPLTRGQTLFEIAPLGAMVVELAIPESDFTHVRVGMPVSLYVHAFPNRKWTGVIEHVHPRAELIEHENVFVGELKLNDPDNLLRPGMRGRATVSGDRHALGWNLFHKALAAARSGLGW